MINKYRVFVGFDQREAIAYHTFAQSLIQNSSVPVSLIPMSLKVLQSVYNETHTDASNEFIYSRFLVPFLCGFDGPAVFVDGDMVIETDIKDLFNLFDSSKAIQVVQHDYKTKANLKYFGNKNEDYPRKNWSSMILWNCSHAAHRILTPEFVANQSGSFLHRFRWIDDRDIGGLDASWNWLAEEYSANESARLIHYTLGTPCLKDYQDCSQSDRWHAYYRSLQNGLE
jgi:hypothetical protein